MTSALPSAESLVIFIVTVTSLPTMTDGSENAILVLAAQETICPNGPITASMQTSIRPAISRFSFIFIEISLLTFS